MTRARLGIIGTLVAAGWVSAHAQQPAQPAPAPAQEASAPTADFALRIYAYFDNAALEEFKARVGAYVETSRSAGRDVPAPRVTRDPAELRNTEQALASRIRDARKGAQRGDIFAPSIESGIKRLLVLEVDAATMAAIEAGNPGEFTIEVNKPYPEGVPLSTVPPNILQLLPRLPEGLDYRFVGRHLILRDAQANVIVDHIPYALECTDCRELVEGEDDAGEETK